MTSSKDSTPQKKSSVLLRRGFSTLILWGIAALSIYSGKPEILAVLVSLFGFGALWELRSAAIDSFRLRPAALLVSAAYLGVILWHCIAKGTAHPPILDIAFLAAGTIIALTPSFKGTINGTQTLLGVSGSLLIILYIPFLLGFTFRVFYLPAETSVGNGAFLLLYLLIVTKFSDMGAFLTGSLIGKHKMAPGISPGKTWQGFGGGILFSIGGSIALALIVPDALSIPLLPHAIFLGALLGLLAIFGDLAESVIKRTLDIKDSGGLLPGIGGILDLLDSVLFTAPVLYFYLLWLHG